MKRILRFIERILCLLFGGHQPQPGQPEVCRFCKAKLRPPDPVDGASDVASIDADDDPYWDEDEDKER